ncbi:MAG: DNA methyltransferase [Candidatus Aenigmatarchaeota archaeon]
MIVKERPEWGELATFIPNKGLPVYNWFYYKEGYARDLVMKLIDEFGLGKGDVVLDPFCGTGTTIIACQEMGIDSMGLDVHSPAVFAATVKSRKYDVLALKEASSLLLSERFQKPFSMPVSPLVKRMFARYTLEDIFFFRDRILPMKDHVARDFLLLALMNVSMKCSYAWKDGAVIKIRKHPVPPLRKLLSRHVRFMVKDFKRLKRGKSRCSVSFGDARKTGITAGSVDAVITSPPYLNKIEYSRIYAIEEELFFSRAGLRPLRSHVGVHDSDIIDAERKLREIDERACVNAQSIAYFSDMWEVIKELHRVCRNGAKVGMVVGNGCFPEGVVDSDMILSKMAEKAGFKALEVRVLSKRNCTKNRVEKVGVTRESLLIWEK